MREPHKLRGRFREDENWREKYKATKRLFERTESQLTNQTQEHILMCKENKLLRRKVKKLELERSERILLLESKCDENENLYHKLQKIEQRILGVPKGKYLLKKNERLQRRIKKLQKTFQNMQTESEENTQPYNLVADDIFALMQQKANAEEHNSKLSSQLEERTEENTKLKTSLKELWESNEYLRENRLKDRENLLLLEETNSQLNVKLLETNNNVARLEQAVQQLMQEKDAMSALTSSVINLSKEDLVHQKRSPRVTISTSA